MIRVDSAENPDADGPHVVEAGELRIFHHPDMLIEDGGNAVLSHRQYRQHRYLLKAYREPHLNQVDEPALAQLVAWRYELSPADRERLDRLAAWPRHQVHDDGRLLGILIPEAPAPFFRPAGPRAWTPRTLYDLLPARRDTRPAAAPATKLAVLGHVIQAVLWLHEHGVLVNDLQPDNILFRPDRHEAYFVDCDSMVAPGRWGATAPLAAPELMHHVLLPGDQPSAASDLAKLAWIVLWTLLDDVSLVKLGADERARVAAAVSPQAADLLLSSSQQRPDVNAWRELAHRWISTPAGVAGTAPAETTTEAAPAAPIHVGFRRRYAGWLPENLTYQPDPPPPLFPSRYYRRDIRRRPGARTVVTLTLLAGLAIVLLVLGASLFRWGMT